jgi:hypothetical protein
MSKEKLIELIGSTKYGNGSLIGKNFQLGFIEKISDHLLANGVTFATDTNDGGKWINVNDDTPKDRRDVLVNAYWHETWQTLPGWYVPTSKTWHVITEVGDKTDLTVSHWREMPESPKGD